MRTESRSSPARRLAPFALLVALAALLTACSLLLDKSKDQCTTSDECAQYGAGLQCIQGVCAAAAAGAAGTCAPQTPKLNNTDFLNEKCTDSKCIPFDNCARLGVCDGNLPALVTPPDGGV